jgi:hypothetical protein
MSNEQMTIRLGDEFDEALRDALRAALMALGASAGGRSWGVAGSQELEALEVTIDGERVIVEAETYMGLSVSGRREVVQRVVDEVRARLRA